MPVIWLIMVLFVIVVCSGFRLPLSLLLFFFTLRKHAYSNILKILQPKKGKKSDKNYDIFHISAQNIDCGYLLELPQRGGSNEYPQSMFLSRNKKNIVYPYKPQFYYIKEGFGGSTLYRYVFVMIKVFLIICVSL